MLLACPTMAGAAERHAAIVIDANTGAVLHADMADETRFPASLTKMMTLYMAFEAIEKGRLSYATRIKVSEEAASQPPTKLGLDAGQSIALVDAMKSLITKSANDMSVAIAEHLAGSEQAFAQAMTQKARLIGMPRTTFKNASGLPDGEQATTARDMATLALRLHDDFPTHYQLFAIKTFSYGGGTHRNHNNLLFNFTGTEGIKTGYTRASGFNLVASVRRGNRHVIGAVFGGTTASRRDDAMRLLLSRALVKASPERVRKPSPTLVAAAKPAARPAPRVAAAAPPPAPVAAVLAATGRTCTHTPLSLRPAQRRAPHVACHRPGHAPPTPSAPADEMTMQEAATSIPPAAQPAISIARVRSVSVEQRQTVPAAVPPAADDCERRLRLPPQRRCNPTLRRKSQCRPSLPRPRQGFGRDLHRQPHRRRLATTSQPARHRRNMPTPTLTTPARGAPPSTLQQQAENMARGAPSHRPPLPGQQIAQAAPPPAMLQGPRPTAGQFEVQIGAFASTAEAERALERRACRRRPATAILHVADTGDRQGRPPVAPRALRRIRAEGGR